MSDSSNRDWLKILDVWANVLGTIGTLAVAVVGIWFTHSFNNSQQKIDRNKALTSILNFIEEDIQLKTVYSVLVDLGYEEDFFEQAVDHPNSTATLKLIDLLTNEESKTQQGAKQSLDKIITRFDDIRNQNTLITVRDAAASLKETEDLLRSSVEIIAVQTKETAPEISRRAEEALERLQEEDSQSQVAQEQSEQIESEKDFWVVIFGSYSSPKTSEKDLKTLKDIENDGEILVYERDGRYRLVLRYEDRAKATDALERAKALRSSAYLRNLGGWCEPQGRCEEHESPY